MLKQETINRLAALAKINAADLQAAITAEAETEVAIDEKILAFNEAEVSILKSNTYKEGKVAGEQMAVDEVKKEMGLEYDGKSVKALVKEVAKKTLSDAKIEPEKKVQEMQEKLTNIQKTVQDYETKLAAKDAEVTGIKINSELYKHIPSPAENGPALGADDVIQLMRGNGFEFKLEEGVMKAYKNGALVQDNVSNAVAAKDVISSFLKEKKLMPEQQPVPNGRGGKDDKTPGAFSKLSDLEKSFKDQGKSTLGVEFSTAVEQAAKANPEFKLDA